MLQNSDEQRLRKLLSDTIPLLCKNSLGYSLEFSIEAFIGITITGEDCKKEMMIVSFKDTVLADGQVSSCVWHEIPLSSDRACQTSGCLESVKDVSVRQPVEVKTEHNSEEVVRDTVATECELNWDTCGQELSADRDIDLLLDNNNSAAASYMHDLEDSFSQSQSQSRVTWKVAYSSGRMEQEGEPTNEKSDCGLDDLSEMCYGYMSDSVPYQSSVSPRLRLNPKSNNRRRSVKNSSSSRRLNKVIDPSLSRSRRTVSASFILPSMSSPSFNRSSDETIVPTSQSELLSETASAVGDTLSLPQFQMSDGVHMPVLIAPTPMRLTPKKRCRVCYASKRRHEVRYCCNACPERPGLCLEPCFTEFHRMLSLSTPALIYSGTVSEDRSDSTSSGREGPANPFSS